MKAPSVAAGTYSPVTQLCYPLVTRGNSIATESRSKVSRQAAGHPGRTPAARQSGSQRTRWAMALAVTEEHQALAESVRGWAERNAGQEAVRAAVDAADSGAAWYAESVHAALTAQGLLGLHLPERQGGQGFGLAELAIAVAELGRGLLPGGYLPTVLASAVLAAAGADGKLVTSLADGTRSGAVALAAGMT